MVKLLDTVIGLPSNAGTFAARNVRATQLPTGVPPNGPETMSALVTLPLGANVTCTLPVPFGPAGARQPAALAAAELRAVLAAATLKAAPAALGAGAGAGLGEGLGDASAGLSAGLAAPPPPPLLATATLGLGDGAAGAAGVAGAADVAAGADAVVSAVGCSDGFSASSAPCRAPCTASVESFCAATGASDVPC